MLPEQYQMAAPGTKEESGGLKMKKRKKVIAALLTASMAAGLWSVPGVEVLNVKAASGSAISSEEFKQPGMDYRPGVRWWWPGGAVDETELQTEIDYLAANGFGYVEINPFGKVEAVNNDEDQIKSIYTPQFYELLDKAITMAEEKDIVVDLNMGSGWNANSQNVTLEDSMGNMALGRVTISGQELQEKGNEALSQEKSVNAIALPELEQSLFYTENNPKGTLDESLVELQGVLIGELTGNQGMEFVPGTSFMGPTSAYNEFQTKDSSGETVTKTYSNQLELNMDNSYFIDAEDEMIQEGQVVLSQEILDKIDTEKDYEVIALYYLPSGGKAIDCANDWFVVDHMDSAKVTEYINDWLGEANLNQILQNHQNIRAVFNDSYEFYSDMYYTKDLYALAKDSITNGLGYDFTKYLPTVYKQYSAAPFYMGLGTKDSFLTYSLDANEKSRITYDYNTLVNQKFQEGLAAFEASANSYGLLYRQEAYNPPIDTIGAAKYVDIPEAEQANEFSLIRVASGAHLYGRNLVTCEQYTLGCTPFKNTLEQVKVGYDIMATSGVNNFFYHGFNYRYGAGSDQYGEEGWSPMPTTGINVTKSNTLSPYFSQMNAYASRANYLMQQGKASKDVALYMPFNGSLSETDAVKAMNYNGYTWDAVNDDSIVSADTQYTGGKILVNGGNMAYDAIIVETSKLPVDTMMKLSELAEAGADIIFYGNMPNAQPGYADGNYAAEDQKVADTAAAMLGNQTGVLANSIEELAAVLANVSTPKVSYATNTSLRFNRRTLEDGGELVYIRNIGENQNEVTLLINGDYQNYYWMDLNNGNIYKAQENADHTITMTMKAGTDTLSSTRSMAVALLCEPAGAEFDQEVLSKGIPDTLDTAAADHTEEVSVEKLTVTADNIGQENGDSKTVTYTGEVLGKWSDPQFQEGELQKVSADGVYQATYTLNGDLSGKKAVLDLGNVYTAAKVTVNGKEAGNVLYAPYTLDISHLLKTGKNEIQITVTPRKYNRYNDALVDTGLEGPVTMGFTQKELNAITITKNPVKTSYTAGEDLDLTGLEVSAAYADGTTGRITGYTISGYDKTKSGTQTITVSYQGMTAFFAVKVTEKVVPVSKVTLNISAKTLDIGKTVQLSTGIYPENASNKKVVYTSSDSQIAAVDGNTGKVTAKSAGKAVIKVTAQDGSSQSAQYTITVKPAKVSSLKVKSRTTNSIELKWNKSAKADGYKILRYDSSKKEYVTAADVKGTKNTYKVSRLKGNSGSRLSPGYIYKFKVQAYQTIDGKKVYADGAVLKTATKPNTAVITKLTGKSSKVTVTWKKQSKVSGYEVWMSDKKGSGYKKIKTIAKGKTVSYTKKGLKKNKKYYFKVRSYRIVHNQKIYGKLSPAKGY